MQHSFVWTTDPHFDHLTGENVEMFGRRMAQEHPHAHAAIITGDIAVFGSLYKNLVRFCRGYSEKTVYVVLGNHDAYGGTIEMLPAIMDDVMKAEPRVVYLPARSPISLPGLSVTGVDGWYDGQAGFGLTSGVFLTDFLAIREFKGKGRAEILSEAARWACRSASLAEFRVGQATKTLPKNILFATHVPPWEGACWHEGGLSSPDYTPWFVNKVLGSALEGLAEKFPEVDFTVLCGHTHSAGEYVVAPNMRCLTGQAEYGKPTFRAVTIGDADVSSASSPGSLV